MCTLMEKDALLEEISAVAAYLAKCEHRHEDLKRCAEIRESLYSRVSSEIKVNVIREELKQLKEFGTDSVQKVFVDNDQIVETIWVWLTLGCTPKSKEPPFGVVLGGQPGAGKSTLTQDVMSSHRKVVIINGDEFRYWHPQYEKIQALFGKDSTIETADFAGYVAENLLKRAIDERFDLIIEGTFRTTETPIKTLRKLKEAFYRTEVRIKCCPFSKSWGNCLERHKLGQKLYPGIGRYTSQYHHDLVVSNLPNNADVVLRSGYVDRMLVFGECNDILYDSEAPKQSLYLSIYQELRRLQFGKCSGSIDGQ